MEGVSKTFYSARHNLTLTFLIGSTEPRSLGRGADRRRNEVIEGGELLELRISKRLAVGRGAEIPAENKGSPKVEFAKIALPSVIN